MKKLIFILALLPTITFGQVNIGLKRLNVNGTVFQYIDPRHKDDLNRTRIANGAEPLVETERLDSLALLRCLRMAKLYQEAADCYIPDSLYHVLVHEDNLTPENCTSSERGAGILAYKFDQLDSAMVYQTIKDKIESNRAGNRYDSSKGHLKNRTDKRHKTFGAASVIIYVYGLNPLYVEDPTSGVMIFVPKAIYFNYELFEQ